MTPQEPRRVTEPFPPLAGEIGLVQGRYGEAGNLELVAPDPVSGFWVFWFNADRVDRREGAAVGAWSGGLHVETGVPLLGTRISQAVSGPDFLEVVARSSSGVDRWYWRPDPGFVHGGPLSSTTRSTPVVVEHGGVLHALLLQDGGEVEHAVSGTEAYPEATWLRTRPFDLRGVTGADITTTAVGGPVAVLVADDRPTVVALSGRRWEPLAPPPGVWRSAAITAFGDHLLLVGRSTPDEILIASRPPGNDSWTVDTVVLGGGAPAIASSTIGGGTLELVTRTGSTLTHARWSIRHGRLADPAPGPLVSEVWTADRSARVHRGPSRG